MSVYSIASHAPFLPTLVERVLDGTLLGDWDRASPFWLTDVTIIVPTRRARLALAEAFAARGQMLLPDIRTFGGEVADEEPFLPPFEAQPPPKVASVVERRLVLSRLVAHWARQDAPREAFANPPTPAEIFAMAESLGAVIDDLLTEERSVADIKSLGDTLGPELAGFWQQTLTFLTIALDYWPAYLASADKADSASLRRDRLDRQADTARLVYGDRPVIAAGSTGSIPATARLLKAINRLPRGAVVLPGLDCTLSGADHDRLLDPTQSPHGHPQYGLARLLRVLETTMAAVTELAAALHPRTILVNRALSLTEDTARWASQQLSPAELDRAGDGLSVLMAHGEDEEARAIAVAARHALEHKRTVGVVTPDRNLARRIAAELCRFDIVVDDAAGTPLFHTPAGRLLRQCLAVAVSAFAPVDLMALLRNRATNFGRERGELSAIADLLELRVLRGQRPDPGLAGLRLLVAQRAADPRAGLDQARLTLISTLLDDLAAGLSPLCALLDKPLLHAGQLAEALMGALAAVTGGETLHGGAELAEWASEIAGWGGDGHHFVPHGLDAVLASLMAGHQMRPHEQGRTDIAIWGQLEARLMSPDLLILAGLNEDIWPEPADPGPWLSRGMRLGAGLEPPERRQGLAAHDFAQGLGNKQVILAYSNRVGGSPAEPSRFLQRLEAFAGKPAADHWRAKAQTWLHQARALDAVLAVTPAARPMPNPPLALRRQRFAQLSVTEIETLMRSPYDLYARHVLRLRPLDPLGEAPDARQRGTIIHAILSRFVEERHDVMDPKALDILVAMAGEEFSGLQSIADRRDLWLRRFATAARQFLDFERARNDRVRERHAEIKGALQFRFSVPFTLVGQADRIDLLTDGTLEIIDFKTGTPPEPKAMRAFEVPQLLLEAHLARAGVMPGVPPAPSSALTYVKVGLGPDAFLPKPFTPAGGMDVMQAADELTRRMQAHVEHFLMRETPLPSRLLPLPNQRFAGAYDHLARVAEWSLEQGEGSEP